MKRGTSLTLAAAFAGLALIVGASPASATGETATADAPDCFELEPQVVVNLASPNNPATFFISVDGSDDSGLGFVAGQSGNIPVSLSGFPVGAQVSIVVTVDDGEVTRTLLETSVTVPDCEPTTPPTTPAATTPATTPTAEAGAGAAGDDGAAVPTAVPAGEGPASSSSLPSAGWAVLAVGAGAAVFFVRRRGASRAH
jgi:hypothetical protein